MNINQLDHLWGLVWDRKIPFLLVFFIVFTLTYAVLYTIDFLPEPSKETEESINAVQTEDTAGVLVANQNISETSSADELLPNLDAEAGESLSGGVLPVQLTIPSLGTGVTVLNPTSRSIPDLDAALLNGVVRHPDSALPGGDGTIFILGHSSYLPVVQNPNFKAFNGIQNLAWGDKITLTGEDGTVFTYQVERVYRARASEVVVPIAGTGPRLTLATCNSFGSVDDRYIVEAALVAR
jgi:sortase (surface protein transpeptidase)